jgi:toxin HigB-1
MIVSYRDRKTQRFADGHFVKEFSSFARQAESRLERLVLLHSDYDSLAWDLGAMSGSG